MGAGTGSMTQLRVTFGNGVTQTMVAGRARANVTGNTNIFLVVLGTFAGTCTATGFITARRMR